VIPHREHSSTVDGRELEARTIGRCVVGIEASKHRCHITSDLIRLVCVPAAVVLSRIRYVQTKRADPSFRSNTRNGQVLVAGVDQQTVLVSANKRIPLVIRRHCLRIIAVDGLVVAHGPLWSRSIDVQVSANVRILQVLSDLRVVDAGKVSAENVRAELATSSDSFRCGWLRLAIFVDVERIDVRAERHLQELIVVACADGWSRLTASIDFAEVAVGSLNVVPQFVANEAAVVSHLDGGRGTIIL